MNLTYLCETIDIFPAFEHRIQVENLVSMLLYLSYLFVSILQIK